MRAAFCRGGYGVLLAFSMSVFARWFAVHPVQAFVWLHAHRLPFFLLCNDVLAAYNDFAAKERVD